jgi:methanogenic corrinoid protein MtbC1
MILGAAERGTPVREIYVQVFQATQREIGRLWQLNEISVAQEHYCTAATQFIMSQLYPYLFTEESKGRKLLAACVEGELHEIGIRMVADFFEMEGWDTTYLGANTPAFGMVDMLGKLKPDLLAISATMPFHVHLVSELIDMVRGSPVSGVKIIVGGYPFNTVNDLWSKVGADAFARDADEALLIAGGLIGSALRWDRGGAERPPNPRSTIVRRPTTWIARGRVVARGGL